MSGLCQGLGAALLPRSDTAVWRFGDQSTYIASCSKPTILQKNSIINSFSNLRGNTLYNPSFPKLDAGTSVHETLRQEIYSSEMRPYQA